MTLCPECTCIISKAPNGAEVLGDLCEKCRGQILFEEVPEKPRRRSSDQEARA